MSAPETVTAPQILTDSGPARGRRRDRERNPFSPQMAGLLVLVGLFAFSALVMLISYSDELRPEVSNRGVVTDKSAVGFSAFASLLEELDAPIWIDRQEPDYDYEAYDLRIYFATPNYAYGDRVEQIDPDYPALIVLPKWTVTPDLEGKAAHVVRRQKPGLSGTAANVFDALMETLGPDSSTDAATENGEVDSERATGANVDRSRETRSELTLPGRDPLVVEHLQFIAPIARAPVLEDGSEAEGTDDTEPTRPDRTLSAQEREDFLYNLRLSQLADIAPDALMGDASGDILYRIPDTQVLVLAEPDLWNNHGLAQESRARAALDILAMAMDDLDVADGSIIIDDQLHRRATEQNIIKLMTRPPFLAATLCLLAAGLLVLWQGFNRFGAPIAPPTPPRGPASLARTSGEFIVESGRLSGLERRYADVVRRQVLRALGLSMWRDDRADAYLTRRETERGISPTLDEIRRQPFTDALSRARALRAWKTEILK